MPRGSWVRRYTPRRLLSIRIRITRSDTGATLLASAGDKGGSGAALRTLSRAMRTASASRSTRKG